MRQAVPALSTVFTLAAAFSLSGCDGCRGKTGPSEAERTEILASAMAAPSAAPPASAGARGAVESIGHPANVIPGQGPKRITFDAPRMGPAYPILPGQGIGPIRFGANRQTIERLMSAPCEDATETLCRYVGRGIEFKLEGGVTKEIRISRKGREAKRAPDGSVIEYGFFNGALIPDLYFGMHPGAIQEHLGPPQKVEKIQPLGADGFAERHTHDGVTLEYDEWSNGKLVLGAMILTKSDSAALANEKAEAERAKRAAERAKEKAKVTTRPTRDPR
jgi:hypothetical protein